jgi:hypothetical protein
VAASHRARSRCIDRLRPASHNGAIVAAPSPHCSIGVRRSSSCDAARDRTVKESPVVPILSLWLPILLSGVAVFIVSSIIHMVLRYHRTDFSKFPDEDAARAAFAKQNLAPGQYMMPCSHDPKAMKDPAFLRKFEEGPNAIVTVMPKGPMRLGPRLLQWFLLSIGIAVFAAYVAGRTMEPGATALHVFRMTAAIAWLGYAGGLVWTGIWKGVPWSKVWKDVFDGLVYGVVTGACFAALWPR